MSVASFVASQRTDHGVPHARCCRWLGVSESWFYKWHDRAPTARQRRRGELDAAVRASFDDSGGTPGTYASPRVWEDLLEVGWRVSKKTAAASMVRQGLAGRSPKRTRRSLTRPDQAAAPIPDLVRRDFSAETLDQRWCGDLTEIPADEGKLYLATVEDLASRRLPGFAMSEHHDATLAKAALCMAAAVRGGDVNGVIFHSDKGGEYTGDLFAQACNTLGVTQSMGRVGSALDNAAAESFNSTLEHELLSRQRFATKDQARRAVARFIDAYNHRRRHSSCEMMPPVAYEQVLANRDTDAVRHTPRDINQQSSTLSGEAHDANAGISCRNRQNGAPSANSSAIRSRSRTDNRSTRPPRSKPTDRDACCFHPPESIKQAVLVDGRARGARAAPLFASIRATDHRLCALLERARLQRRRRPDVA
jgi:putative transposase